MSELLREKQEKVLESLSSLAKRVFSLIRLYGVDSFDFQTENERRVANGAKNMNLNSAVLCRVPKDYYSWKLEERKRILGTSSIHELCKSIIVENVNWISPEQTNSLSEQCKYQSNSRFYCILIQYTARLSGHKVFKVVRKMNSELPKTRFHFALAKDEDSFKLTNFGHNGITPIGAECDGKPIHIPIILSDQIAALPSGFFWLGGGEVDVKLGVRVLEFIEKTKCVVADVTADANEKEIIA